MAAASPGIEPEQICQTVGIESTQLSDPCSRVPITQLVAAFETAAKLTGDGAFGLHVGARTQLRSFGLLGYIVMNCSTFGEALDRVVRYFPLWTDGAVFRFNKDGSSVHLRWEYVDPSVAECRHDCEMTLLCVAKISHLLYGDGYRHREVHFQHPAPRDVSEHRRLFRAPVCFSRPSNQLIFDKSILAAPLKSADPDLLELLLFSNNHRRRTAHECEDVNLFQFRSLSAENRHNKLRENESNDHLYKCPMASFHFSSR